jgi:cobaltochelatase CobT
LSQVADLVEINHYRHRANLAPAASVLRVSKIVWDSFRNLWISRPDSSSASRQGYYVYTTQFDRVISANEIGSVVGGEAAFREYALELDRALTKWRAAAEISAIELVARFKAYCVPDSTLVSLLVDHSGSMKGQRAILAIAIVEIASDFLSRLNVRYEILGFTTRSWQGGATRQKWLRDSCPASPGRLCDLLHIVYRTADDDNRGAPWTIRNVARPELLKENVDGEAIAWAVGRIRSRPEPRKTLIVISDGAPVDDSTILENGLDFLPRHLQAEIAKIESSDDMRIAAVGIDFDVSEFYSNHVMVITPDDIATRVLPFIATNVLTPTGDGAPGELSQG